MSFGSLGSLVAAARRPGVRLVSTDLFDTVLLRDDSTETGRLAAGARRAADRLGVDPEVLTRLRWWAQEDAYRAVTVGRPQGEARLSAICAVTAAGLGLDARAAEAMRDAEVDVDITHLGPHRSLLDLLDRLARSGLRIVAVSDTHYSGEDLTRMLTAVCGRHPISHVYSSADLGLTKHAGGIFAAVAAAEGVPPSSIVHVGDNQQADVDQARQAGWAGLLLPRESRGRVRRTTVRARAVPEKLRRMR